MKLTLGGVILALILALMADLSGCGGGGGGTTTVITPPDNAPRLVALQGGNQTGNVVAGVPFGFTTVPTVGVGVDWRSLRFAKDGNAVTPERITPDGESVGSGEWYVLTEDGEYSATVNYTIGDPVLIATAQFTVSKIAPVYDIVLMGVIRSSEENDYQASVYGLPTEIAESGPAIPLAGTGQLFTPNVVVTGFPTREQPDSTYALWSNMSVQVLSSTGGLTTGSYNVSSRNIVIWTVGDYLIRTTIETRDGPVLTFDRPIRIKPDGGLGARP